MHEEFDTAVLRAEEYSYTIKTKFDSGTTVEMIFYVLEFDRMSPSVSVEVCLNSYTKRSQVRTPDFYYTARGKDGLRPAIWATNLLLKFPAFLLDDWAFQHKDEVVYTIFWSEARRRDVYYKWLSRYGFYFGQASGSKCLTQTFFRS
jgi:hypothetical protein